MKDNMVARDVVNEQVMVSTVYLQIDHGYDGVPLWYETMVFKCDAAGKVTDWLELDCERYSTRDEAIEGHGRMVADWITKTN